MALIHLDCPKCGAHLPPREATGRTRCEYCGANFEVAKTIHAEPPKTVHVAPGGGSKLAGVLVLGGIFCAAGVAVAVGTFSSTQVGGGGLGGPTSWTTIDSASETPIIAAIGGRDHVIARTRTYPDDQLYVVPFDLETGEERYRVGPLGSYSDAYRATHFEVAGDHLLVTTHGKLRVLDLATGAAKKELALTDRADHVCLLPGTGGAPPQVFVEQADERDVALDLAGLTLREAKLPEACEVAKLAREDARSRRVHSSDLEDEAPKIAGFEPHWVHVDGDLGVVRGVKAPGTAYPMAAGFDPKSLAVRWKQPIAAVDLASVRERDNEADGLAGGRYYATYGEGQETWHLAAFDAQTGARLWDTKLRGIFAVDWLHSLTATDTRVLVQRMSSLEIFDAKTGELLRTIGKDTYD